MSLERPQTSHKDCDSADLTLEHAKLELLSVQRLNVILALARARSTAASFAFAISYSLRDAGDDRLDLPPVFSRAASISPLLESAVDARAISLGRVAVLPLGIPSCSFIFWTRGASNGRKRFERRFPARACCTC
jgi:hypothetical protein